MITSKFLVTVSHTAPITALANRVEGRLWGMDKVENVEAVEVGSDHATLPPAIGEIAIPAEAQVNYRVEGHNSLTCLVCTDRRATIAFLETNHGC